MENKFRITFYMVKRIIQSILVIALTVWLIFLLIPRTNHYQYDCMLYADYEYAPMIDYYGGSVHVTADLHTKTIFNRIYINGEVTIQNKKYIVSEKQFIPRSILARIKTDIEYGGTMMPDYNNTFWLDFDFSETELKEYKMHMDILLTYNRISLDISKIENIAPALASYTGYFK